MSTVPKPLAAALADRYRIERELGAGGMATVYLAHDVKHDRKVALKVMRPELSAVIGAERFLVEIKTTANLQHPHILALYDSGQVDGTVFYVMPFVEGETLRDRLDREKQLPVGDAVRIATEVAGALDYAHRHGVIHRDIKPANILLHDGRALVADFGIALAASRTDGGSRMTETGMSLGTPHYMSPEQALGERNLDARTDVYALGCVLHEMLAGEPPFDGPTAQAIVARVMSGEPESVTVLRKSVPDHVADAILTALSKLPADRFASAAEFAAAIGADASGASRGARATRVSRVAGQSSWRRVLWPAAFAVATLVALWGWFRPGPAAELQPSRLAVLTPGLGGAAFLQRVIDITSDGRTLVYVDQEDGMTRIVRRALEDADATVINGVPRTFAGPLVSPDAREFVATDVQNAQMFRYPMDGGTGKPLPRDLAWANNFAWGSDGTLWLSPQTDRTRGIARVSPAGEVTHPFGGSSGDLILQQVLPDDRFGLAVRAPIGTAFGPPFLMDLGSGDLVPLFSFDVVEIRYTSGLLVYLLNNGTLEAVRFDLRKQQVSGSPIVLATGVALTGAGQAQVAVAANGTVAYVPDEPRSLVLVDRSGNVRTAVAERHNFHIPRFSPDGRRLLVDFTATDGRDVWQVDLDGGAMTRITFDRDGHDATWEPDGRNVTYSSALRSGGALTLYRTRAGRAGEVDSLISSPAISYTGVWLPDRSAILTGGNSLQPGSRGDIAIIRSAGKGPVEPVVATRFDESFPALSADGKWIAYTSDQSGIIEVYVRPLSGDGDQVKVSLAGGTEPVWARNGLELFYRSPTKNGVELTVATLQLGAAATVTDRRRLFDASEILSSAPHSNYDVSPDGRTFAMVRQNPATRIIVLQNMPALFRQLERGGKR
ncbi:MAG: serine/threonine-protein kinase [Gemmatimonadetes bacterium]|nr:serine/threonine-protein kinase [Gemmatimonadota bacterium]